MHRPLISLIVPVYQTERYLPECMDSVLQQTYENLEIILVDDGSTDGSPRLCDEYARRDGRITVIHKRNAGVSSARNAGISAATGEYIGFIDSDDSIEPVMMEWLMSLLLRYNTEIAVCGLASEGRKKRMEAGGNTGVFDRDAALRNILSPNGFGGFLCNKLFSRRVFDPESGGNAGRLNEEVSFCEDMLCVCQILMQINSVAYTTQQLYHYRNHPASASAKFSQRRLAELDTKQRIIELLQAEDTVFAKACYSNTASYLSCMLYMTKGIDAQTVRYLQREAKKYIIEFRAARYPVKDNLRMLGVLVYPPVFCRLWNIVKAVSGRRIWSD